MGKVSKGGAGRQDHKGVLGLRVSFGTVEQMKQVIQAMEEPLGATGWTLEDLWMICGKIQWMIWVSINGNIPQNGWFISEKPWENHL